MKKQLIRIMVLMLGFSAVSDFITVKAEEVNKAAETFTVDHFTYDVSSGSAAVTAYTGNEETVSVPETVSYQGITFQVSEIGEDAFAGNTAMKSVTLSENVRSVGNGAFYDCINLSSVTINGDLAGCENYLSYEERPVFYNAGTNTSGITVTFGNGVLRVPNYLFAVNYNFEENTDDRYHPMVKKVVLPDSITIIGEGAFYNCQLLDTINWPEDLEKIGNRAFVNTSLTSITFGNKLREIGDRAFYNCPALEKVVFPKTLEKIRYEAFWHTSKLNSITFNSDVDVFKYETAFAGAGRDASSLVVTFGSGMKTIPAALFKSRENYAHITDVVMADTITKTDYEAFQNCADLKNIKWSENLEFINGNAFEGTAVAELVLPEKTAEISIESFKGCRNLEKVILPASLNCLNWEVFSDCVNLSYVEFSSDITAYPDSYAGTNNPFYNTGTNADGMTVKVNENVTRIPPYLFATEPGKDEDVYCHVSRVILANTLSEIGKAAFFHCYDLKEVEYAGTEEMWNSLKTGTDNTGLTGAHITFRNQPVPKPPVPKLLAVYNGAKGIGVRWQIVPNADSYQIWRKYKGVWSKLTTVKASDTSLQKTGTALMYTDTGVKTKYGEGYIYSVAAIIGTRAGDYNKTGLAVYRLINPKFTKAVPTGSGKVTLTWTSVACHGYEVQYATEADAKKGSWTKLPQTTKTTLTVSGLKKGVRYAFRIRCQKTNKDRGMTWSEYSPWISAVVK